MLYFALFLSTFSVKIDVKNERKRVTRMCENAYLSIKNPKASRALKRALDPSLRLLTLLARLCFATSATFGPRSWGPPWPNPGSAPAKNFKILKFLQDYFLFSILDGYFVLGQNSQWSFPQWSRTFTEFSDFSELRESDKSAGSRSKNSATNQNRAVFSYGGCTHLVRSLYGVRVRSGYGAGTEQVRS